MFHYIYIYIERERKIDRLIARASGPRGAPCGAVV